MRPRALAAQHDTGVPDEPLVAERCNARADGGQRGGLLWIVPFSSTGSRATSLLTGRATCERLIAVVGDGGGRTLPQRDGTFPLQLEQAFARPVLIASSSCITSATGSWRQACAAK